MLRFAFSPTRDMELGDLRVALINFIVAQQRKEDLIVRVDDTSTRNNIEGKDKEYLDILDLFGIRYTQTIHESQNFRFHTAMALQLMHEKKAFSCFCSPDWIQGKMDEAQAANKPYLYDDACANLPAELVIDNTNPFTVRIHRPEKDITVTDAIQGELTFKADTIDSFMILKQDKTPMADFASAVEDMLSDISLVIQDQDHIESAPKQVYVRDSLQYDKKVQYAHIPPMTGNDIPSVTSLLEQGYLPKAIVNYLISMDLEDAIEQFDLAKLSPLPVAFDLEKLKEINKQQLKSMDAKELSRYVGFADSEIGELARLYVDEVETTRGLKTKIAPIFSERNIPEAYQEQCDIIKSCVQQAPYFEEYDAFKAYIIKETGMTEENFSKGLRILLTNSEEGPELTEIYKYLKNYLGEIIK
ncbi:glutamate--tRNA ligase family protein [Sulfurimonas sp. C5]|uniref:glutamate--tRNA ligase n=1 Tax=Sulfurimonas sp. C5 TaxID=3036947 RepID=UPI0024538D23|nr:glutamate--tRNA ligase family protein [Sulfurimonas sp. C5]MDH4943924.1 glutamate--tRNA ligase family protein [Sulfurimonas sp. C5]